MCATWRRAGSLGSSSAATCGSRNVTSRRALKFGITAEAGAGGDYEASRTMASQVAAAGFDGVVWLVRHDPRLQLLGIALFGPAERAGGGCPDQPPVSSTTLCWTRRGEPSDTGSCPVGES